MNVPEIEILYPKYYMATCIFILFHVVVEICLLLYYLGWL